MLPIPIGLSGSLAPGTKMFTNNLWLNGFLNRNTRINNINAKIHTKSEDNINLVAMETEKPISDHIRTEPLNEMFAKQICFIGHSCTWLPSNVKPPKRSDEIYENTGRKIIFLGHSCTWLPKSLSSVVKSSLVKPMIKQSDKEIENDNLLNEQIKKDDLKISTVKAGLNIRSLTAPQIHRVKITDSIENVKLDKKKCTNKTENVIQKISIQNKGSLQRAASESVLETVVTQRISKNDTSTLINNDTTKLFKIVNDNVVTTEISNELQFNSSKISPQSQVPLNNSTIVTQNNISSEQTNNKLNNLNINRSIDNSKPVKIIESTVVIDKITKMLKVVPTKELLNLKEEIKETFEKIPIKKNTILMGQSSDSIKAETPIEIMPLKAEHIEGKINQNLQNIATCMKDKNTSSEEVNQNTKSFPDITQPTNKQAISQTELTKITNDASVGSTSKNFNNSKSNKSRVLRTVSDQKEKLPDNTTVDIKLNSKVTDLKSTSKKFPENFAKPTNEQKINEYNNNNSSSKDTYCNKIDIQSESDISNKTIETERLTKSKWIENVFKTDDTNIKRITKIISPNNVTITTPIGNICNINSSLKSEHTDNESKISDNDKLNPSNQVKNNEINKKNCDNITERNEEILSLPIKSEKNLLFMGHSCAWIPENFGITPSQQTLVENIEVKEVCKKNQYSGEVDKQFESNNSGKINKNKSMIPKKENISQIKSVEKLKETSKRNIVFMGHSCTWMPENVDKIELNKMNIEKNNKTNQDKKLNIKNPLKTTKGENNSLIANKELNNSKNERKIKSKLSSAPNGIKKIEINKTVALQDLPNEDHIKTKECSTQIMDKPKPINYKLNSNSVSEVESKLKPLPTEVKDVIKKRNTITSVNAILTKPPVQPNIGYFIFQDLDDPKRDNTESSAIHEKLDKIEMSYKQKIQSNKINNPSIQTIKTYQNTSINNTESERDVSGETGFILINKNKVESPSLMDEKCITVPSETRGFVLVEDVTKEKVTKINSKQRTVVDKLEAGKETGFILINDNKNNKVTERVNRVKAEQSTVIQSDDTNKFEKKDSNEINQMQSKKSRIFVMNDTALKNYKSNLQKYNLKYPPEKEDGNIGIQVKNEVKKMEEPKKSSRIPISKSMKRSSDTFKNLSEPIILSYINEKSSNSSDNKTGKLFEPLKSAKPNEVNNANKLVGVFENDDIQHSNSVNNMENKNLNEEHAINILKKRKNYGLNILNSTVQDEAIAIKVNSKEKLVNTQSKQKKIEDTTDILKKEYNAKIMIDTESSIKEKESYTPSMEKHKISRISRPLKKHLNNKDSITRSANEKIALNNLKENDKSKQNLNESDNIFSNSNSDITSDNVSGIVKPFKYKDPKKVKKESNLKIPDEQMIKNNLTNSSSGLRSKIGNKHDPITKVEKEKENIKNVNETMLISPLQSKTISENEEVKSSTVVDLNGLIKINNNTESAKDSLTDIKKSEININSETDNLNKKNAMIKFQKHNVNSINTSTGLHVNDFPVESNTKSEIQPKFEDQTQGVSKANKDKDPGINSKNETAQSKAFDLQAATIQKYNVDTFKMGKTKKLIAIKLEALKNKQDKQINNTKIAAEFATVSKNEQNSASVKTEMNDLKKIDSFQAERVQQNEINKNLKKFTIDNFDKLENKNVIESHNSEKSAENKSAFVIETIIKKNLENTASKLGISKLTSHEKQSSIPDFNGTEKLNELRTSTTPKLVINSSNKLKLSSTKSEKISPSNEKISVQSKPEKIRPSQEKISTQTIFQNDAFGSKESTNTEYENIIQSPFEKYSRNIDSKLKQIQDDLEKNNLNVKEKNKPIEKTDQLISKNLADETTIQETSRKFQNILSSKEKLNVNQSNTNITINTNVKSISVTDKINITDNKVTESKSVENTEEIGSKKPYIPLTFSITKSIEETKPITSNTSSINKSGLNDPTLDKYKNYFQKSTIPAQNNDQYNSINDKKTINNNSETLFQQLKNMIKEDLFTYPREIKEEIKENTKKEPKSKLSVESCAAQTSIDSTVKPESIIIQVKDLIKEELFTIPKNSEKMSNKVKTQNNENEITRTTLKLLPGTKDEDQQNVKVLGVINSETNLKLDDNANKDTHTTVSKLVQADIKNEIKDSSNINFKQSPIKKENLLAQAKSTLINTTSLRAPKLDKSENSVNPRKELSQLENKTDLVDTFKDIERTAENSTTLKASASKNSINLSNVKHPSNNNGVIEALSGVTKIPANLSRKEAEHISIIKSTENLQQPEVELKPWGETVSHPPTLMDKFKAFFKNDNYKSKIQTETTQIKSTFPYDSPSKVQQDSVLKSNNYNFKGDDISSYKYDHSGNKDILNVTTESRLKYKSPVAKDNPIIESENNDKVTLKSSYNSLNSEKSRAKESESIEKNNNINYQKSLDIENSSSTKSVFQIFSNYIKSDSESVTKLNSQDKLDTPKSEDKVKQILLLDHLTNINTEQIKYDNQIKLLAETKLKTEKELKMKIDDVQSKSENNELETLNIVKSSSANIIKSIKNSDKIKDTINDDIRTQSRERTPSTGENKKLESNIDDTTKFLEIFEVTKPGEISRSVSAPKDSTTLTSNIITKTDENLKQRLKQSEEISKIESVKLRYNTENINILNNTNKNLESSFAESSSLPVETIPSSTVKNKDINLVQSDEKNNKIIEIGKENKNFTPPLIAKKVLSDKMSFTLKNSTYINDDTNKTLISNNNSIPNDKNDRIIINPKIPTNLKDEVNQNRIKNDGKSQTDNQKINSVSNNEGNASKAKFKKSSDDKKSSKNQKDTTTTTENSTESQSKSSVVNFMALPTTTSDKIKPNLQDSSTGGTIPIEMDRYNSFEATPFNKNDIVVKILHSLKLASIKKD